jgi:uncharacterized membrane protein
MPVASGRPFRLDRSVDAKFWLWLGAVIIGVGIATGILFLIVGAALATWGIFGALMVFGGLALAIAWFYDRRKQHEYD